MRGKPFLSHLWVFWRIEIDGMDVWLVSQWMLRDVFAKASFASELIINARITLI